MILMASYTGSDQDVKIHFEIPGWREFQAEFHNTSTYGYRIQFNSQTNNLNVNSFLIFKYVKDFFKSK